MADGGLYPKSTKIFSYCSALTLLIFCDSTEVCEAKILISNERENAAHEVEEAGDGGIPQDVGEGGADLRLLLGHLLCSVNKVIVYS